MPTPGLLYQDYGEHVKSLLWDVLLFVVRSFYFIWESLILSLVPDRFRSLKVKQRKSGS